MIVIKSEEDLACMRRSGQIAAEVRDTVAARLSPGVTTGELDDYAAELIKERGATSAFLGYKGYPRTLCTSVDSEVVHGIPGKRRVELGSIVSIDVGILFEGFVGDTATTVMVGTSDERVVKLLDATQSALAAGIEQAVSGNRLGDISNAIEKVARRAGFSIVKEFVGHGIGRTMHEDPQVPNYGPAGKGPRLKAGMTLALEPMINLGAPEVEIMDDGWTVRTRDRMPSAHFEHTVAIHNGQAEILTQWTKEG
jgi:methionyl aminopeptidase